MEPGEKSFNANSGEQLKIAEIAKELNVVLKNPDSAKNLVAGMDVSAQESLLEALFSQKEVRDEVKRQENKESFLERYKVQLENIDKILVEIRSLDWKRDPAGEELKRLLFRFLTVNENNNNFKLYIKDLDKVSNPDEILSDKPKESSPGSLSTRGHFRIAFSEIFRMYAFAKVEPFRDVLEKVDFPFSKFEQTLDDFRNFFKQEYELEFIVPNLWMEKINPELYTKEYGSSHILANRIINIRDFESDKESGTIIDFQYIGLKSKRLGIDEKAKVYLYSKV